MHNLTLKSFKQKLMSFGHVFSANIYLDNKKIGYIENSDSGCSDHCFIEKPFRESFEKVIEDIFDKASKEDKDMAIYESYKEEGVMTKLVDDFYNVSNLKKFNKKVWYISKDGKNMVYKTLLKDLTPELKKKFKENQNAVKFNFEMNNDEVVKEYERLGNFEFSVLGKYIAWPKNLFQGV